MANNQDTPRTENVPTEYLGDEPYVSDDNDDLYHSQSYTLDTQTSIQKPDFASPNPMERHRNFSGLYQRGEASADQGVNPSEQHTSAIEGGYEPEAKNHRHQTRTKNFTFDAPTKSSIAKKNGKVELPPIMRVSTIPRQLLAQQKDPLALRQQNILPDEIHPPIRGQIPSHRRQRSHSFDQFPRPAHSEAPYIVQSSTPTKSYQRVRLIPILPETYAGVVSPTELGTSVQTVGTEERSLERDIDTIVDHDLVDSGVKDSDKEGDLAAATQTESGLEIKHAQGGDHTDAYQVNLELNAKEARIKKLQQDLVAAQVTLEAFRREAQVAGSEYESLQQMYQTVSSELDRRDRWSAKCQSQTEFPKTLEAALEEIVLLREKNAALKTAEKESEEANAFAQELYDELEKLQLNIQALDKVVEQKSRSISEREPRIDLSEFGVSMETLAPTAKAHAASLVQFFRTSDELIEKLRSKNSRLAGDLAEKTSKLAYMQNHGAHLIVPPSARDEDRHKFEELYKEEHRRCKAIETNFAQFRETTAGQYDRKLKSETARLQDSLRKCHRRTLIPRLQAGIHQASARLWEDECKVAKQELLKRTLAFEEQQQALQNEMILYIRDYHEKTHDKAHWNLPDLHAKIASMEREQSQTNHLFHQTKIEKARLEDAFARLTAAAEENKKYIETSLMLGGNPSSLPPFSSLDEDDAASSSSSLTSAHASPGGDSPTPPYSLRFLRKQEKCKQVMIRFRQDQEKRRLEEECAMEELLERLRRHRIESLNVRYPPHKPEWAGLVKLKSWGRWNGQGWLAEVKLTPQEEYLVRDLREKRISKI